MRVDKEQWQMVFALVLVAVVAAGLLATTDIFTREPIAQAQREALRKALLQVLPEHVNDSQADVVSLGADKKQMAIYPAKDAEKTVIGLAWEVIAPDGYSGTIKILVGVRPEGKVHAIRVTFHRETPGLGDGIVDDAQWLGTFVGKGLEGTRWAVKKDGGEFDQFTGATITPRAVVKAVKGALEYYKANQKLIFDAITTQNAKPKPKPDVPESSPELVPEAKTEAVSKAVQKATTEAAVKKPVPEVNPETVRKAAAKVKTAVKKVVSETIPAVASKSAVKKPAPEAAPEVSPEAVQKDAAKAKAAVKKPIAKAAPAAAVKAAPVAEKLPAGKTSVPEVGNE
jgi:electron transport complex protein RnfG